MELDKCKDLFNGLDSLFNDYEKGLISYEIIGQDMYEEYAEPLYYALAELIRLKGDNNEDRN